MLVVAHLSENCVSKRKKDRFHVLNRVVLLLHISEVLSLNQHFILAFAFKSLLYLGFCLSMFSFFL